MQDQNLTDAEQRQLEELLWNNSRVKFLDEFKQFQSKYASSLQFKEMFPVYGEFSPQDNDEVISDEKRLLNEVLQ